MLNDILGQKTLHQIAELRSTWFHQESRGIPLSSEQQMCKEVFETLWQGIKDLAEENERLAIFVREAEK